MIDWAAIEGLLFDKDGTLIDFFSTWTPACCEAAEAVAAAVPPGAADRLLLAAGYDRRTGRLEADSALAGGSNRELIELWRDELGEAAPRDLSDRVLRTFARHATRDVVATADMAPLMATLRRRGLALGMATNDDTETARWTADRLGIRETMVFVAGADAGYGAKPDPGMGLAFCRAAGVEPRRAAMVGDSAADARMARAAGFGAAVGVRTGAASGAELDLRFDATVDSVADLPALLFGDGAS